MQTSNRWSSVITFRVDHSLTRFQQACVREYEVGRGAALLVRVPYPNVSRER